MSISLIQILIYFMNPFKKCNKFDEFKWSIIMQLVLLVIGFQVAANDNKYNHSLYIGSCNLLCSQISTFHKSPKNPRKYEIATHFHQERWKGNVSLNKLRLAKIPERKFNMFPIWPKMCLCWSGMKCDHIREIKISVQGC